MSAAASHAQSFDCSKARDAVDQAVCASPRLRQLDTDMAKASLTGPNRAEVMAQHPLGRVATPGEVADTAAWLALDAPATMTGCIIDINGASYLRT